MSRAAISPRNALFLGRLVTELLPQEPEALGLLALMLHAEARRRARRNAQGEYVPLAEQDTSLWDSQMIDAAESLLMRASTLGKHWPLSTRRCSSVGARASPPKRVTPTGRRSRSSTTHSWPSPDHQLVAINRALAIAEMHGAEAALLAMEAIAADSRLIEYQPYWAARAELLAKIGANGEASHSYEIAIGLERDAAVRQFLQRRQSALMP